jgi:transposase InsO family protein
VVGINCFSYSKTSFVVRRRAMIPQGRYTTYEERVEISERARAGQTDPEIATAVGRSVWTVRKWRRKVQKEGRQGLSVRLGRPSTGPLGQCTPELRGAIRMMGEAHPGWGPLTLRLELEADPRFEKPPLPSRSRIAAFLHQQQLTRPYQRHIPLPQPRDNAPTQAHQEWELDAQGVCQVMGLGQVSLINLGDVVSRLKVGSYPCVGTSKPSRPAYQLALRNAFVQYGLPHPLSLDHATVFYASSSASPYPMAFQLWLIALGIDVRFIRKGCPTDHGCIERTHQTVHRQAIVGQSFSTEGELEDTLEQRLDFLNRRFPSRALGGKPPLVAYPQAGHSGRPYHLHWEAGMLDLQRVYAYLAQGRWFRKASAKGQVFLGAQRYGLGKSFARQTIEMTFDPTTRQFICRAEDGQPAIRLLARGLTKADLMGALQPRTPRPGTHLELPLPHPLDVKAA